MVNNSLNKQGTVVIRVPNMANPFSLGSRYSDTTHEIGFTEASLRQVLKIEGFESIRFYPTGGTKSIKGFIGKMGKGALFMLMKFMYRVQGYGVPRILSMNILAAAKR